jgi:NAD(P)-dependent dehydrogenase (short-subunit alcohol dehydrogenase family)
MAAGGRVVLVGSRTAAGAAGRGAYAASKATSSGRMKRPSGGSFGETAPRDGSVSIGVSVAAGARPAAGAAGRGAYAASKAALVGLARSWAAEQMPRALTVIPRGICSAAQERASPTRAAFEAA